MVGLEGFGKRDVTLLSGGQQQRVAIARALVNEPKVLLLDEPLGALDAKIRKQMQVELKKIQQEVGITFIYVTHDQEEALSMSDTVVVMNNGEIQQIGSPTDIYNEPENRFVAGFIGESNIIEGTMIRDYLVELVNAPLECQVIIHSCAVPVSILRFNCNSQGFLFCCIYKIFVVRKIQIWHQTFLPLPQRSAQNPLVYSFK